jgi:transcriptional regulator with XRE-family HTH domain
MKFDNLLTDAVILREIGARIKHKRVDSGLTQAQLAQQAGIAKRAVERLEGGSSTDSLALIRALRALKMLENLENALPDIPQSPVALLKKHGRKRMRVRAAHGANEDAGEGEAWKWGNET